jgi:enoyl-CoA hydratase/carnithine racemase
VSVHVETVGDALILTIDRPAVHNAIDRAVARAVGDAVRVGAAAPSVRGVVITGGGSETFVSGGDLRELDDVVTAGGGPSHVLEMGEDLAALERCDVPVVAAVNGAVLGGGSELLLLCDVVVMERHGTLSFRHAKMGLSPAWGGVTRLIERVGSAAASKLLLTAERITAEQALALGLVNVVVEPGEARAHAIGLVNRIADNPRSSVASIKRAIREVRDAMRGGALAREQNVFASVWGADAHRAAMDAYRKRRG